MGKSEALLEIIGRAVICIAILYFGIHLMLIDVWMYK